MKRILNTAFVLMFAVFSAESAPAACVCVGVSPLEDLKTVDAAFVGRIVREIVPDRKWTVKIEKDLKGDAQGEITLHASGVNTSCEISDFEVGEKYVLFLDRIKNELILSGNGPTLVAEIKKEGQYEPVTCGWTSLLSDWREDGWHRQQIREYGAWKFLEMLGVETCGEEKDGTVLPARYDEHRFFVEPVLEGGGKMVFYTDTGGGLFVYRPAAEKLGLTGDAGKKEETIGFPVFHRCGSIPEPLGARGGRIFLYDPSGDEPKFGDDVVGLLGQHWFADRVWTFDYPNRKLIWWKTAPALPDGKEHRAALGFKTDTDGKRVLHFPRIGVEIGGRGIDLLFDTGATTTLTEEAHKKMGDKGGRERATSFITSSLFEQWRRENPDWRVLEKAESGTGEAMIEVPRMRIAGHEVGPVWFTRRADKNFHEYMSRFTDKRVEGALGGSALRYFRVTVDYPRAFAFFERP